MSKQIDLMFDISTIISVITGILLTISELLPFFKNLDGNGILHLLANISKTSETLENQPLLQTLENLSDNNDNNNNDNNNNLIEIKLNTINDTLYCMTSKIQDSLNNVVDNSRTLKLQQSELYELNYIINYIKANYPKRFYITKCLSKINKQILISQGYIVDYDVQHDTYVIKW